MNRKLSSLSNQKPITRIGLILFLIILLPALFFSIYELSSLSENEKVIQSIYNNQLDAILFSVNQYSEDIVGTWATKLNLALIDKQKNVSEFQKRIDEFLSLNTSINLIFFTDSIPNQDIDFFPTKAKKFSAFNVETAKKIIFANESKTRRLFTYKQGGYQKFETLQDSTVGNNSVIMFLLNAKYSKAKICVIIFDPNVFIRQILLPKLQNVSQQKFTITVFNNSNNRIIYSTEEIDINKIEQRKSLWLLPDYSLGITLKGETISGLVNARSQFNLALIVLLNIVLITGLWLAYKSIRKEIELAQIKSDFVSNVSHELRTPLALITMFAETLELERVKTEEKKKEYYKIISQEANRLSKIVNKILNFSKMEAGKIKYHLEETDLNNLVENIFNTYTYHLQSNGFVFSFQKEENLSPVKADKEALSEAIINLIDNAVKYSDTKKDITIKTGKEKESVYVEVQDCGIGISKEDQKRIFEKFYRVTSGNLHNTKGTGLGLSLVKYIVDVHKAKITVDSNPGKGSSFKISLPVKI
ncbi:MAG: HAMP domain-containing sensor histidine kinase [Ignavibacteriales bacterium]|nr:HAMP domain-containing sensor histidine kinase [Ignavibacteriales bacterium]